MRSPAAPTEVNPAPASPAPPSPLTVTVLMSGCSRLQGGMFHSIRRLWQTAHVREGIAPRVRAVADPHSAEDSATYAPIPVAVYPSTFPRVAAFSKPLEAACLAEPPAHVVSVHGLWQYHTRVALRLQQTHGTPVIVHPHGMLEEWALQFSRWKKRLVGGLWHDRFMRDANCFRALTRSEWQDVRRLGLKTPVAIIPNGILLEDYADLPDEDAFAARFPEAAGRKRLLFLSRIHPKKGLPHLIEAWKQVADARGDDWVLMIAGPDQLGHEAEMRTLAADLGIADAIHFTGPLYDEDKRIALSGSHAFVLPSFSEGFPVAVLEASACRLPIVMTPRCNFPELEEAGGGIVCQPEVESTAEALRQVLAMSDSERDAMGAAGRRLVEERYSWAQVAHAMGGVTRWLAAGAKKAEAPDCVVFD
ncbi:MAG: glycosyltransferase [Sumerlaeia bacterium]